jgi:predicted transcriptional regulator
MRFELTLDNSHVMLETQQVRKRIKMNKLTNPTKREIAERKKLIRTLAQERRRQSISQDEMAIRMRTQQPSLARMETGSRDPQFLTLQRYAASLGKRIVVELKDI